MSTSAQLPRVLGPWIATAIVIGTVIGSGVFKKPQEIAATVPAFSLVLLIWVLGGVLALLGSLVYAEIAILLPRAGGNYVYLREGFGQWAGFLWGWVEFWIIRAGSIAALATVFSESLHDVLREIRGIPPGSRLLSFWAQQGLTVATIVALALVNIRGTRWGGVLQLIVTSVKVASLLAIMVLPFVVLALVSEPQRQPQIKNLFPFWPTDWLAVNWSAVGGALVGVLWAYHGWMNIAPVAEEVERPQRNLPLALLAGTGIVTFLYVGVNVTYSLVVPRDVMANLRDTTVAAVTCSSLLGPVGGVLATTAVMISVFGSLNGNLLVGPRLLFAMGRDRLAPAFLSRVHPCYQTPALATAVLAGWSCLLILGGAALTENRLPVLDLGGLAIDLNVPPGKTLFGLMTDFAMFGAISFETLAIATVFAFRRRYPVDQVTLPYRCWGHPWLPLLYIAIMVMVLGNMFISQRTEALIGLGFIGLGALVYVAVFRQAASPEEGRP